MLESVNSRRVHARARVFLAAATVMAVLSPIAALAAPDVFRFNGGRYDRAASVATDAIGNWYVAGSVERTDGKSSFAVVKHRPDGGVDWVGAYSGASGGTGGSATAVAVDAAGNVYAAGHVYHGGTSVAALDYLVVKFDANGVERWAQRYNGPGNYFDNAAQVAVDLAGTVYVSGQSYGTSFDWATLKISSAGALLWVRRVDGTPAGSDDQVIDMHLDAGGNPIVMGRVGNASGAFGNDVRTIKYDQAGQVVWQATFTETTLSDDVAAGMDVDAAGNVTITGQTSATSSPEQPIVPFLVKYAPNGQLVFRLRDAAAGGTAVTTDVHGNIYVTGSSTPVFATLFTAVARFSPSGSLQWLTPVAATSTTDSTLYRIVVDALGVPSVAGVAFDRSTSTRDFLTMRFSASGGLLWQHRFNGVGNGQDEVVGLALDVTGNLLVVGTSWGGYVSSGGTAEDIVTLKFAAGTAPTSTRPLAPTNLATQSVTASRVTLRWTDRSDDENGFRIERCTGQGCSNFAPVAQVASGMTSVSDAGVAKNTKYLYRVLAFNDAGASGPSNVITVQTPKK